MLRNFIRQSYPWTTNITPMMGRWRLNENIDRKVDLANVDNYGDRVCGDLKPITSDNHNYSIQTIVDDYNNRWKKNITVKEYLDNFTRKHRGAC